MGAARRMPCACEIRAATSSQSDSGFSSGWIRRWPLRPRILSSNSLRKPFITAITMMSVATPEHDAEEGKPGDDRDESFLAPRPQVAQRQHPLEWGKRPGPGRLAHVLSQTPILTRFWLIQAVRRHESTCSHTGFFGLRCLKALQRDSRSIAAATLISSLVPPARFFTSTLPSARLFGPTRTCHGNPIRSAVLNLVPARSSRSS